MMKGRHLFNGLLTALFLVLAAATSLQAAEGGPDKDAGYWVRKGALASAYGGDPLAIRLFTKAVSLDPTLSDAWFLMGVSYGELRWFDKAVESIDRAIGLRPDSGLYYYGRGRIYLMLGAADRALEDFSRAASLGNDDARQYLKRRTP